MIIIITFYVLLLKDLFILRNPLIFLNCKSAKLYLEYGLSALLVFDIKMNFDRRCISNLAFSDEKLGLALHL